MAGSGESRRTGFLPRTHEDGSRALVSVAEFLQLLTPLDEQSAAQKTLAAVREVTKVDASYISRSSRADATTITFVDGLVTDSMKGTEVRSGRGLGGKVLAERRPVATTDYQTDRSLTSDYRAVVEPEHIRGVLGVPIFAADRMQGVLFLANRVPTDFGAAVIDAAVNAAAQVGLAFGLAERARHDADMLVAEERRRIAVALHDSVGALLFSIRASVRTLEERLVSDRDARAELERIEAHAGQAATALHASLQALHATATEVVLGVAVREDARHFSERSGVRARVAFTTEVPALDPARVQAFVDVVREALLNVEKHARAHSVMITVFADDEAVNVVVADDGVGVGAASEAPGSRIGISAAGGSLARLGGRLAIEDNPDGGTSVRARIPR